MEQYPELDKYVNQRLAEGVSLQEIQDELVQAGWDSRLAWSQLERWLEPEKKRQIPLREAPELRRERTRWGSESTEEETGQTTIFRSDESEAGEPSRKPALEPLPVVEKLPRQVQEKQPSLEPLPAVEPRKDADPEPEPAAQTVYTEGIPSGAQIPLDEHSSQEWHAGTSTPARERKPRAGLYLGLLAALILAVVLGLVAGRRGWIPESWRARLPQLEMPGFLQREGGEERALRELFEQMVEANREVGQWQQEAAITLQRSFSEPTDLATLGKAQLKGGVDLDEQAAELSVQAALVKMETGDETENREYELVWQENLVYVMGDERSLVGLAPVQYRWVSLDLDRELPQGQAGAMGGWKQFETVRWWRVQQRAWEEEVLVPVEVLEVKEIEGRRVKGLRVGLAEGKMGRLESIMEEELNLYWREVAGEILLSPQFGVEYWLGEEDNLVYQWRLDAQWQGGEGEGVYQAQYQVETKMRGQGEAIVIEVPEASVAVAQAQAILRPTPRPTATPRPETTATPDARVPGSTASARDQQRIDDLNDIGDALGRYLGDLGGDVPEGVVRDRREIGMGEGKVDLAEVLVPEYMSRLPVDPRTGTAEATGYSIFRRDDGRVALWATSEAEANTVLQVIVSVVTTPRTKGG